MTQLSAKSLPRLIDPAENARLQARLEEAEDTLRAIRSGEADALVVKTAAGARIFVLEGADAESSRFRGEILAQVSDAIIVTDSEDRVIYLNAATELLYGLTASEALGRRRSELYRVRWPRPEQEAAKAIALGSYGQWRGENVHVRHDGRDIFVESSVTVLKDVGGLRSGILAVVRDVTERKQNELEVLISEIRYRRLFETAHDGVLIIDPSTRKIIDANPYMSVLLGYTYAQLIGKELFEIGLVKDEAANRAMFQELKRTQQVRYENLPLESQGGRHQDVEVVANLYDENGRDVIQFNIRDITERRLTEEHVKMLMGEVNHRAKNLLAVVQAIANQTARHGDPKVYAQRLCERIAGLAAGQDLLVKSEWQGIDIEDLVESQLAHFKDLIGIRVFITGPRLQLATAAAQGIGMALHELATNAGKYGALSNSVGQVRIAWHVAAEAEPLFLMSWLEDDGPAVRVPTQRGFGSLVIGRLMEAAVGGVTEILFRESGVSWNLRAPVKNVLASTEGGGGGVTMSERTQSRAKRNQAVLIVEDEPVIAYGLEELLIEAGFEVAGVTGKLEKALEIIESGVCGAAILDANLAGVSAAPAASALTERGVPFLVLSGYLRMHQAPEFLRAAIHLHKPCPPERILQSLRSILPVLEMIPEAPQSETERLPQ